MQKFYLHFLFLPFLILLSLTATITVQDNKAAALYPDEDEYCWGLNFM